MSQLNKYLSRKFIITILLLIEAPISASKLHEVGVGDSIVLAVLGLLTGVGVAYGVVNVKDAQTDAKKDSNAA